MTLANIAGRRFRTPPGWPPAPTGWTPPAGWTPPPQWSAPPDGWVFWEEAPPAPGEAPPSRRALRRAERELAPTPPPVAPPPAYVPLEPLEDIDARALGRRGYRQRLEDDRRAWHALAADLHRRLHERDAQVELLGAMNVVEREARAAELAAEVADWATALDVVREEIALARAELDALRVAAAASPVPEPADVDRADGNAPAAPRR